jgi:hypothetical protein
MYTREDIERVVTAISELRTRDTEQELLDHGYDVIESYFNGDHPVEEADRLEIEALQLLQDAGWIEAEEAETIRDRYDERADATSDGVAGQEVPEEALRFMEGVDDLEPTSAETILEPEGTGEGNWIGAPTIAEQDGEQYLAVRERGPERRGHTVRIYRREGDRYEDVMERGKEAIGAVSMERPDLVAREDGRFELYLPVEAGSNDWSMARLGPVKHPSAFDSATATTVLEPGTMSDRETVKDGRIVRGDAGALMYYAGHDGVSEQGHVALSRDGEDWERHADNPVLPRDGWHDFHTRVSAVVDPGTMDGRLVFYEGSGIGEYKNTWNMRTGLAYEPEQGNLVDMTPDGPVLEADCETAFSTLRYIDVVEREDGYELFFEAAQDDGTFALQRLSLELPGE